MGVADAGHYYSIIRDRINDNWLEFNDNTVRPFDINSLSKEAFGNVNSNNINNNNISSEFCNKIKNAYLIVYDKKTDHIDNN
jgi:hypothetical protein